MDTMAGNLRVILVGGGGEGGSGGGGEWGRGGGGGWGGGGGRWGIWYSTIYKVMCFETLGG